MTQSRLCLTVLTIVLGVSLTGCDLVSDNEDSDSTATTGVYVANQGNFGDGNGSVTVFDPETQETRPSAVSNLGSTVQGIAVRDTSLLVMANSAARLDVFSTDGPTQTGQVTDLSGPRYAAFTTPSTAYVTDQSLAGPSAVHVVDLSGSSPQVTSSISVSGLPDGITVTGDRAYAALGGFSDTTLVAALDASDNTLVREIDIGCYSRAIAADGDGDVFALCSDAAEAVVLDGASGEVETRLSLPDTAATAFGIGYPVSYSAGAEELYVTTDTGIIPIDTQSNTVADPVDVGLSSAPGAVAYNAARQELYVARVPSFTERGTVTIHDRDGEQTGAFDAGIAPTYVDVRRTNR